MRLRFLVAAAVLSASLAARADTYNYSFSAAQGGSVTTVSFNEPAILSSTTVIPAADLVSSSTTSRYSIASVFIDPLYTEDCTGVPDSCIVVNFSGPDKAGAFFPNSDLTSAGVYTYNVNGGTATLTITDLSVPSSTTPEPSSFALLGTGLLCGMGVVKRRFD